MIVRLDNKKCPVVNLLKDDYCGPTITAVLCSEHWGSNEGRELSNPLATLWVQALATFWMQGLATLQMRGLASTNA